MPVSKKPRKKGKRGHEIDARKKLIKGKFKTLEEAKKAIDTVEKARIKRRRQCEQLAWMLDFTSKESLLEAFTKSIYAIERWKTTTDFDDFNCVGSSLMLGALCHQVMGVQEKDLLEEIQHAAFMATLCRRLRSFGKSVPDANLDPVRRGLVLSQDLMEYAYEHDRQALINVLKHNCRQNVQETQGLQDQHERFILGKHYDVVQAWERDDAALMEKLEKQGTLPPPSGEV